MYDLIITGLPCSGTTLVAAHIDAREGVCCLSEPQVPQQLGLTPQRWAEIAVACSVRIVAMTPLLQEFEA